MILKKRYNYPESYMTKCRSVLDSALERVPVYKGWKKSDPGSGAPVDIRYAAMPVLTKADMRAHFPNGLMPDGKNLEDGLFREEIEYTFTSGTTSEKVVNIWDQDWWNRSEAASWTLNAHLAALDYPQRQAKLASSLNVGISCEEDLPMSHRILGDTLYLNEKISVLQWQLRHLDRMATELNTFKPMILEANPSLLARLAYWCLDNKKAVFSPQVIVFTFEFPSALHLAAIRKVFTSAFVSSYGSTETGFVMQQCGCGLMHQNIDFCRIDFQPLKAVFGGPELGRLFVTTFGNPWNWIIRFDIGDIVRLHPQGKCACGCDKGMIAAAVEGRTANVTFGPAGGLVTTKRLDDSLAGINALRDYRLEQTDGTHYLLEAMLSPGGRSDAAQKDILAALKKVYGNNGVYDIRFKDNILPGPAGKFRRTGTLFDFDERRLFE